MGSKPVAPQLWESLEGCSVMPVTGRDVLVLLRFPAA